MCADIRLPLHISSQQKQKPKTPHSHHLPPLPYLDVHLRWDRSPYALNAACLGQCGVAHAMPWMPSPAFHPPPLSRRSFWKTLSRGSSTSSRSWAKRHSSSPRSKLANSSSRSRLLFSEKKMAREKYHQELRKSCFFNGVASFTTRFCLYKYINVCVCGVYIRTRLCAKELTTSPPSRPLGALVSLLPPSSSSSSSSRACKCRCSISLHHSHSKTSIFPTKMLLQNCTKSTKNFQQMSVPAPNPLVYLQPRMALQVVAYLDGHDNHI